MGDRWTAGPGSGGPPYAFIEDETQDLMVSQDMFEGSGGGNTEWVEDDQVEEGAAEMELETAGEAAQLRELQSFTFRVGFAWQSLATLIASFIKHCLLSL